MQYFPAALERLSEQFARLPGIGAKTAQRLAFYVLSMPEEEAQSFSEAILDAKHHVKTCPAWPTAFLWAVNWNMQTK